jgi:hypothetical protein
LQYLKEITNEHTKNQTGLGQNVPHRGRACFEYGSNDILSMDWVGVDVLADKYPSVVLRIRDS